MRARELGYERSARSRTSRRISCGSASRSCRTSGCRRRSRTTASAAAQFRHCGQYAVSLPLRPGSVRRLERAVAARARRGPRRATQRRAAAAHAGPGGRGARPGMTVADIVVPPIAGGIAAPAGFRAAGVACGIKKARPRPGAAGVGRDRRGRRGLHDQQGAGGAGAGFQGAPGGAAGTRARSSSTAAAPTRARARTAGNRAGDGRRGGARAGCDPTDVLVASTGVIGVTLDRATVASGIAKAAAALAPRRRRARGARHHDDRSLSQGSGGRGHDGQRTVSRRRHGQGLRHDRAA